jgi:phenylacetate-CoA ligase
MLARAELLPETAQSAQLTAELSRCSAEMPLYRQSTAELAIDLSRLQDWPFITKKDIRRNFPANFLGEEQDLEDLIERDAVELEHTSGTSEERTALLLPKGWWAEQELRALNLNPVVAGLLRERPKARRATINSPVCSGDIRYNGVPSRDERVVGNSLFVSLSRFPFLWGPRDLERIAQEIVEWRPDFLDVDPVYGVVFALYCERRAIRIPSLRFILCSYEFVSVVHRAILNRVFGVPVFDLYGSTETGHLLMEDEQGEMRPSLETAFFEVVETDNEGVGQLVVSTLTNPLMPLIRYRIGDLVERVGSQYGARYQVHGREADSFQVTSKCRVTTLQVDRCFRGLDGFAHYQLIQQAHDRWLLKFVADGAAPGASQLKQLQERLGRILCCSQPVTLQQTDILAPESSGKFRLGYPNTDLPSL